MFIQFFATTAKIFPREFFLPFILLSFLHFHTPKGVYSSKIVFLLTQPIFFSVKTWLIFRKDIMNWFQKNSPNHVYFSLLWSPEYLMHLNSLSKSIFFFYALPIFHQLLFFLCSSSIMLCYDTFEFCKDFVSWAVLQAGAISWSI